MPMNRRLRAGLYVFGGVCALLLVTAVVATYVVLQPERFTALLQSRARAAGLELTLANPASPTLWPSPALDLEGVMLRGEGSSTPLIVASRGRVVLPWHTLLGGEATISRLEVEGARIDVDAVSAYLDTLPSRPSTAGATLPTIDAGFRIARGTLLRGTKLVLSDIEAEADRLASGRRFTLTLSARLADGTPYALDLDTVPTLSRGVLTLADMTLGLDSDPRFESTLKGTATWRGGADVGASLTGRVTRHDATPYDVALRVMPANENDPLYVALKLDGDTDHADLRLPPLALAQWWTGIRGTGSLTMPPLVGTVQAQNVDAGSLHVKGLRIRATPDAPAATATVGVAP
ncbi:membrane assembly protein AsmA [Luteibacter sp. PPL552]